MHAFTGVLVAGGTKGYGAAAGERNHLGQNAVSAVAGADGGGVSVHCVLDKTAAGRLGDAGRRNVAESREKAGSVASEPCLEILTEVLGNAVKFYLGVSVVDYAAEAFFLKVLEDGAEKVYVVPRKIDAVRVFREKLPVVLQGVLLHLETGLNGIEDGVYVYLGLICIPQGCLHV